MTHLPLDRPERCFWELTRACEHLCLHCRAEGGTALRGELSLEQSLQVADQLVLLKVPRVVLTGGEPTHYPGWEQVARRLADGGVRVRLFTSGVGLDAEGLETIQRAGVTEISMSLDGPRAVHDALRPLDDSFRPLHDSLRPLHDSFRPLRDSLRPLHDSLRPLHDSFRPLHDSFRPLHNAHLPIEASHPPASVSSFDLTYAAIKMLVSQGWPLRLVTQANRKNIPYLDETYEIVRDAGVRFWQIHLFQATGRGRTHLRDLAPDPEDLKSLVRVLLRAAREKVVVAPMHCTVGYLTPEEPVLRARLSNHRLVWTGTDAGLRTMAISATGRVSGCTCLPAEFATASVLERPLSEIWSDDACFPYSRQWSKQVLDGKCAQCAFGELCRAGCPAVAYGITGTIGANPYCLRHLG